MSNNIDGLLLCWYSLLVQPGAAADCYYVCQYSSKPYVALQV